MSELSGLHIPKLRVRKMIDEIKDYFDTNEELWGGNI